MNEFFERLKDYNWEEVFGEGSGRNCTPIIPSPAPIGSSVPLTTFSRADVAVIYGMEDGENDGDDWIIYGKLKDGRYFAARGGCDYTGWDCCASNSGNVALTKEDLIAFGLGDSERSRFGISL